MASACCRSPSCGATSAAEPPGRGAASATYLLVVVRHRLQNLAKFLTCLMILRILRILIMIPTILRIIPMFSTRTMGRSLVRSWKENLRKERRITRCCGILPMRRKCFGKKPTRSTRMRSQANSIRVRASSIPRLSAFGVPNVRVFMRCFPTYAPTTSKPSWTRSLWWRGGKWNPREKD